MWIMLHRISQGVALDSTDVTNNQTTGTLSRVCSSGMCVCARASACACVCALLVCVRAQMRARACVRACKRACVRVLCVCACACVCTWACTRACDVRSRLYNAYTHTYARTYACTHTDTCMNVYFKLYCPMAVPAPKGMAKILSPHVSILMHIAADVHNIDLNQCYQFKTHCGFDWKMKLSEYHSSKVE